MALNNLVAALLADDCEIVHHLLQAVPKAMYATASKSVCAVLREGITSLVIRYTLQELDVDNLNTFLRGKRNIPQTRFLFSPQPHFFDSRHSHLTSKQQPIPPWNFCSPFSIHESLSQHPEIPDITSSAILGGIVMLRLVSPYIVSFARSNSSLKPHSRSNLISVAKLLQSTANSQPDIKYGCGVELNKLRSNMVRFIKSTYDDVLGLEFSDLLTPVVFDPNHGLIEEIMTGASSSLVEDCKIILNLYNSYGKEFF
ncbi:hypothetical protein GEMRC1_007632 [Eukaryota sp. GEM-RC1]